MLVSFLSTSVRQIKRSIIGFIGLMLLLFTSACSDPMVIIPGAALSGDIKPAPQTWQAVPDTIQLETRPVDPYSVNIWGVAIEQDLYVATRDANWMAYIEANPLVRVRVSGDIYELSAKAVDDAAEMARVVSAYVTKYDVDDTDGWVQDGVAYRLDRR